MNMKWTKLSLVAALAMSSAFAGGDIAPAEPVVEAPVVEAAACNSNTTIDSKAVLYYYTDDNFGANSVFDKETSSLAAAVTVDVSHKIMDGIIGNLSGVGYSNLMNESISFGGFEYWTDNPKDTGAFLNVANITATYGDTTFVLGRQLLFTPQISGFDWLLASGSYEAYTVMNKSIPNVTLTASYITEFRGVNSGVDFEELEGDNWTVGAAYSDAFDASIWYYNVDDAYDLSYTQVYADAGMKIAGIDVAAQYVNTDWDVGDASNVYGIKASGSVGGFDLMGAYVHTADAPAGFIDNDAIYTTMWNSLGSNAIGDAFKVEASTEFSGFAVTADYVNYEETVAGEEGSEFDLILGYGLTNCISLDAIYSNTDYGDGSGDNQALELIATYKF
ncbi:hypothetical protein [Sulfurovum sp. TSL1]|uniref:hypothetical protein n=1 Tax=Sulfurovum sp. TSL1 TaxID=2826994 RepID=UPI001CC4F8CD|nr:hypothetical protein [Sulfurovum sp. TSL1]GIT97184.1 hypothetical protein TSL1_00050 [Sulfurovum sp. TSL1]